MEEMWKPNVEKCGSMGMWGENDKSKKTRKCQDDNTNRQIEGIRFGNCAVGGSSNNQIAGWASEGVVMIDIRVRLLVKIHVKNEKIC